MTATTHGRWNGLIVLNDARGDVGWIPLARLKSMAEHAAQRDRAKAKHLGRTYDRDALTGALDTARTIGLVELEDCDACHDAPGTSPMGDGLTFCQGCCSAAAGSY